MQVHDVVSTHDLPSPFPWFGSKRPITADVWRAFGRVEAYYEPFFGTGRMLFDNPHPPVREIVNDLDSYVCNFWRAVQADPEAVASYADWPINELDLHARHAWLIEAKSEETERLRDDPTYHSTQHAGWWVWGLCAWIGRGWCSANDRRIPHLGSTGQAIHRQRPHLSSTGRGIHRQRPHLGDTGRGSEQRVTVPYLRALQQRLRHVWVCCGDWSRILTPAVLFGGRLFPIAVFLDPPYSKAIRDADLYATDTDPAPSVAAWARQHGADPRMRIALCGYEGEHDLPGWSVLRWKTNGGMANTGNGETQAKANKAKECVWFSPHCIPPSQLGLFDF